MRADHIVEGRRPQEKLRPISIEVYRLTAAKTVALFKGDCAQCFVKKDCVPRASERSGGFGVDQSSRDCKLSGACWVFDAWRKLPLKATIDLCSSRK